MKISCIYIQNFRKLHRVKIELADQKNIFVGANNSGKTSVMHAIGKFLKQSKEPEEKATDDEGISKRFVVEDLPCRYGMRSIKLLNTFEYSTGQIETDQ